MRPFSLQNDGLAALVFKKLPSDAALQDHRKNRKLSFAKRQQLIAEDRYDTMPLPIGG